MDLRWLIPLIALAVWVLSNLARNREEPRRPVRPQQSPPAGAGPEPPGGGPRPRRSSAEIDDFLQEVRRRRDVAERKPAKPATARVETLRPVEPPRPRPSLAVPAASPP